MRRIVFGIFLGCYCLASIPFLIYFKLTNNLDKFHPVFVKSFAKNSLQILNLHLVVKGNEIKEDLTGTLIVSNHQSLLDPMVLFYAVPKYLFFVSKKENLKVPIIGWWWMRVNTTIFIDREDIKKSIKDINLASKFVEEGNNLVIFPQGTRNRNVLDYKPGSLKIASKAKADILPVGIKGTGEVFDKFFDYKAKNIELYVYDVLHYKDYKKENMTNLQMEIQNQTFRDVKLK